MDWIIVDGVALVETHRGVLTIDEGDLERVKPLKVKCYRLDIGPVYGAKSLRLCRFLTGLSEGDKRVVRIVDGNSLNCQRSNLLVTSRGLGRTKGRAVGTTSIYKGVYREKATGQWIATVAPGGKTTVIGRYDSEEEAALAYDREAPKAYGPDILTNAQLVELGRIIPR